jgi:hypothetical protein
MPSRSRPEEGKLERWARGIVAQDLGVEVTRYDDGSTNRMVDALIQLPGGPIPLEVVSDADPKFEEQWAVLRRTGPILRTNLLRSWMVFLTNDGHVKKLRRALPRILADWPRDIPHWHREIPDREDPIGRELRGLGVAGIHELEGDKGGQILLTHEGWNNWDDPIELNEWVLRVLTRESDVATKLELHGGAERHTFIWALSSSADAVNSLLADDDDDIAPPSFGPALPPGITHLWVASTITRRGCFVLHGGRWRRTDWITIATD